MTDWKKVEDELPLNYLNVLTYCKILPNGHNFYIVNVLQASDKWCRSKEYEYEVLEWCYIEHESRYNKEKDDVLENL